MKTFLLHIILIFIICCLWLSCSDDRTMERVFFGNMDSLLEANPDSAYRKLLELKQAVDSDKNGGVSHIYTMYLAEACNKLETELPSDTLLMEMAAYFDCHGTSNQQMKSRYLLGCYYRDNGESPLSIDYYEQAVELADTTDVNCDYLTLMRIYGQMAEVYNRQALPSKEIEADRQYSYYAMKVGNRYEYIRGIELQMNAYNQTGDTTKVLELTDSVNKLYKAAGMEKAAASTLAPAIFVKIKSGDLVSAKKLIDVYEKKSGLFDENGEIAKDRSLYYFVKGKYYLESGNRDSSELMFRKLGKYGHYINAYYGLVQLYKKYENGDSVYKYTLLYDDELVKYRQHLHSLSTSNVSSLYNYKRKEEQSVTSAKEKIFIRRLLIFILSLFIIVVLSALVFYKKRQKQMEKIRDEKEREASDIRKLMETKIHQMETASNKSITEKNEELENLRAVSAKYSLDRIDEREEAFLKSESVTLFRQKSELKYGLRCAVPTDEEWHTLESAFKHLLPVFHSIVLVHNKLTPMEKKVCMLCRMGIRTNEIQIMLNKNSSQAVSNIKSRIKEKLFQDEEIKQLETKLKELH